MKIHFHKILNPTNLLAAVLLTALPAVSQAVAITYDIQSGSAPNFSGSWIHSADTQLGSTGYFANGIKTGLTGSLTIDTANLAAASGQLTANGNFGLGNDTWTIDLFNGASSAMSTFIGGDTLLLSLDYTITGASSGSSTGTFYFANRDFTGVNGDGDITNGPNYFNSSILYLWGNNWVNVNGAGDKPSSHALGLDLYGVGRPVPAPSIALLLGLGLLGMGTRRFLKSA